MTTTPLADMLQRRSPLILDGAMGSELQRRGADTGLPLWSASALLDNPELVRQIHEDYAAAGADIITTDTFRTTRRTFLKAGLADRSKELTQIAVELAAEVRRKHAHRDVLIAGSMAPLEDCYRPDLVPSQKALEDEHAELAARLAHAGVDFLLLETMGTLREAAASCTAAVSTGKETVISFLCDREGNLYDGSPLAEAVAAIAPLSPALFSINCVSPRFMGNALKNLRAAGMRRFGVYGNVGTPGGERGDTLECDVNEKEYGSYALQWFRDGAVMIGGCCGTTPGYIRALHRIFEHPSTRTAGS